jgi:mercuric ion transport protein
MLGSFGGAVASAFGSAVCCAGPTVAASMGLSTAGLSALLPYRPLFIVAAAGLIWYAYHLYERVEATECGVGGECADPAVRRRMKIVLWGSTFLVVLFASSPFWIDWVL